MFGIDVGYGFTKVYPGNKLFPSVFCPSRGDERPGLRNVCGSDDLHVTINNEKFIVGKLALREGIPGTFDKYRFDRHKICVLTGIALMQRSYGGSIALGLPISDFHFKPEMHKLIGSYDVELNGKKMMIDIEEVFAFPQGGAMFLDMTLADNGLSVQSELANQRVGYIDIGEKTINFCWMDRGEFVNSYSGTLDLGMSSVYTQFVDILSRQDILVPPHLVRDYLYRIPSAESDRELSVLANKIVDAVSGWWNYKHLDQLFIGGGGGGDLFKDINKRLPNCTLVPEFRFANARGFYKFGLSKK